MSKETYLEIRENLNYIYSLVNNIINTYEMQKKGSLEGERNYMPLTDIMLKLGEVSSILQIDIHRLDMLFSINNIQSQDNYKVQ